MNKEIDQNFFEKKGYVLVRNFLSEEILKKISLETDNIIKKSRKGYWPYIRVYNDYPHFFGNINIFGTDFPFNNKLNDKIYPMVNKIDITAVIKKLMGWNGFRTSIARLHSFTKFYNYQGMWHRDHEVYPSPNTVQTILYLKKEKGFRLVPRDKNNLLNDFGLSSKYQTNGLNQKFINLPNNLYDVIDAKAGDLLVFESGLLHQGHCKTNRCHFIFRHDYTDSKIEDRNNLMNFDKSLLPDYIIDENIEIGKIYKKNYSLKSKFFRLKSFLLYFLPRFKSIYRNIRYNKSIKEGIYHSTIFQ